MPTDTQPAARSSLLARVPFQFATVIILILLGLAMVANTHLAGDGAWFEYAILLHNGKRLYADLHLVLQPFIILETDVFLRLFGSSWLATHIPAVLNVIVYVLGVATLASYSRLSDRLKAVLIACGFLLCISFVALRFDDFHVIAETFKLYTLIALANLRRSRSPATESRRILLLSVALGVIAACTLLTRLPEGAALILGIAICLPLIAPSRKLAALGLFFIATALTVLAFLRIIGDTLHDWAANSIFKAAAAKGGASTVLSSPRNLPREMYHWIRYPWVQELALFTFGAAAVWVFLLRSAANPPNARITIKRLIGTALLLFSIPLIRYFFFDTDPIGGLSIVGDLVLFALITLVITRFFLQLVRPDKVPHWNVLELLLVVPFGQMLAALLSSAGQHIGLYDPLAMMILVTAIASPLRIAREPIRATLIGVLLITALFAGALKIRTPYSWHTYVARPMFVDRHWYHHPLYGPMLIDSQLLAFIQPICKDIANGGADGELLSLPYGYANYFCAVPPWHDYVTTFYDTTSPDTMHTLITQLQTAPPKWILYQRELDNLTIHEEFFHHGEPIPQRVLDHIIMQKLATHEWQSVYTSDYQNRPHMSNEWILIRTRL